MTLHRTLVADAVARVVLRPYQQDVRNRIEHEWSNGNRNVLAVLPTGAGKTVLFSSIIADEPGASCAIAHRQELVSQISLALARNRVRHRIVGPQNVIKMIVRLHMEEVGANYYDPNSRCAVAGVDTLVRRGTQLASWTPTVKLWVQDEAHHLIKENKWGKAVEMFPNARGLGVTATPCRSDGQGLGRHADGVFDAMVIGPSMRDLINGGNLTDYKLYAPPSNFDRDSVKISATTGDFVASSLSKAVSTSNLITHTDDKVVGNVVDTYRKLLSGMLTVVFAPDVKTAYELESQYLSAGIPAKCLHGGTPDDERQHALRDFKNKKIMVLINVSLFDEGFDLPAIEAVQDVAATASFGRFVQRVGRALRLKEGKVLGHYVDHVGNIAQHCQVVTYEDGSTKIEVCHREWTLDRREKRSSSNSDAPPIRVCTNPECVQPFERFRKVCPYCGTPIPPPAQRSEVEFVDGDITELDPMQFAQMRAAVARVDMPAEDYHRELAVKGVPQIGIMAHVKRHIERQGVVGELRDTLAHWGGEQRARGLSDGEIYRKFYLQHGVDMITCQTGKSDEMRQLIERVKG